MACHPALHAQSDGFTVQERSGLALTKPQAWSTDAELSMIEFSAFTDRTVKNTPGAGYYEFRTKLGDKRQIPAAKVVELVVYPDLSQTNDIISDADRQAMADSLKKLQSVVKRFPAAGKSLGPSIKKLTDDLAQYDAGKVRANGAWVLRTSYVTERAASLTSLIRADILRADPPSSFDLKTDPRFITLQDFAQTNSGIKAQADELANLYAKLLRAEQRKNLLAKLADPKFPLVQAQAAVGQLRSLSPEEDPRSVAFLKSWDAAREKISTTSAEASKLAYSVEAELSAFRTEDIPPTLSPALERQLTTFNDAIQLFLASQPPPPLLTTASQTLAVCAERDMLKKVKAAFDSRQFIEAKDALDAFSPMANAVGPESVRVVTGLQHYSASRIEEFTKLREEAKLLNDSGKKADSIKKYEAAFAVIPDQDVAEKISALKGEPPK